MTARAIFGSALAVLFYSIGVVQGFVHIEDCGLYATPPPGLPAGAIAGCDDWSVTAINDAPALALMVLLCIAGTLIAVRISRLRSVSVVVAIAVLGTTLGAIAGFIYSGIDVVWLLRDLDYYFVSSIAAAIAAIMGSLEIRRLPNTSLERTRER